MNKVMNISEGLLRTTSRLAILAAAGVFAGTLSLIPAQAADLGGDCCADLEERVADLEATTARKGNRRVSLTVSGQVSRAIGWIEDDNGDSEFYSAGNGASGSEVVFSGEAKLSANWTAGYEIKIEFGDNTDQIDAAGKAASGGAVEFTSNVVSLTHAQYGTVAIGLTGAPTDGVSAISLAGRDVSGDSDGINDWNGVAGINTGNLAQGEHQAIAYISPTIAGFTLAVAWADLDYPADGDSGVDAWDMALRYANEFGPIQLAAGIGYTFVDHDTDATGLNLDGANLMGSVAIKHVPTGLNIAVAAGKEFDGGLLSADAGIGIDTADASFWHVEGGIVKNFTGVGDTSIYGEYGNYDTGATGDDETTMWGLGIVQTFDSAATELFIAYRQWEDDDSITDGDVSQILAGMRIGF